MPAPRFFVMLEAARKLRNRNLVWDCYTSRAASMQEESFTKTVEFFDTLGEEKFAPPPIVLPEGSELPKPHLKGRDAKKAVMGAFAKGRRIDNTQKILEKRR